MNRDFVRSSGGENGKNDLLKWKEVMRNEKMLYFIPASFMMVLVLIYKFVFVNAVAPPPANTYGTAPVIDA